MKCSCCQYTGCACVSNLACLELCFACPLQATSVSHMQLKSLEVDTSEFHCHPHPLGLIHSNFALPCRLSDDLLHVKQIICRFHVALNPESSLIFLSFPRNVGANLYDKSRTAFVPPKRKESAAQATPAATTAQRSDSKPSATPSQSGPPPHAQSDQVGIASALTSLLTSSSLPLYWIFLEEKRGLLPDGGEDDSSWSQHSRETRT